MKKSFLFCLAVFPSFLFFSCFGKDENIQLQAMSIEELSPRVEWALITDPYVACRNKAGYENSTVASFRKGEIYEVRGNCTVKVDIGNKKERAEKWYALEDGWIPGSAVRIFSNKMKAQNAKMSLR